MDSLTLLLIALVLNPFKETPEFFIGSGLNELLQTDLMIIHHQLFSLLTHLYIHFCSFFVGNFHWRLTWNRWANDLTCSSWLITTIGIGLGGLWAYLILDWGGYWAWDPVETGSFLPWLVLVGLSHMRTRLW